MKQNVDKWYHTMKLYYYQSTTEKYTKFLQKYKVPYHKLYMRETNDKRKDYIVKRELYEKYVKPYYSILFWLDDRDQVVDMVRTRLNLTCFQVNYGAF